MLKSMILKQEYFKIKSSAEEALKNNDKILARKLAEDAKVKKLEIENAISEELELKQKKGSVVSMNKGIKPNDKKLLNAVVCKTLLGKSLNEFEQEFSNRIKNAVGATGMVEAENDRGGVLVPIEMLPYQELRNQYSGLRPLVDVIPTSTKSGWIPVSYYNGSENYGDALIAFDELSEITQDDLKFSKLEFKVKDYGLVIPISRQLMQDADADVMGIVTSNFVRRQVMLENSKITDIMNSTTQTDDITTDSLYVGLKKAYNQTLIRQYGLNSVIVTNQTGLQMLDSALDKNGNFILQPMVTDQTRLMIGGHEVFVLDNAVLPDDESKGTPIYVGDLKQAAAIVDREALEIASDYSAGFTKNAIMMRAIARMDFLTKDTTAIVKLNVKASVATGSEG